MSPVSKEIRQKKSSQKGYISLDSFHVHILWLRTKIWKIQIKMGFFWLVLDVWQKSFKKPNLKKKIQVQMKPTEVRKWLELFIESSPFVSKLESCTKRGKILNLVEVEPRTHTHKERRTFQNDSILVNKDSEWVCKDLRVQGLLSSCHCWFICTLATTTTSLDWICLHIFLWLLFNYKFPRVFVNISLFPTVSFSLSFTLWIFFLVLDDIFNLTQREELQKIPFFIQLQ
jgi:hypothetical protein